MLYACLLQVIVKAHDSLVPEDTIKRSLRAQLMRKLCLLAATYVQCYQQPFSHACIKLCGLCMNASCVVAFIAARQVLPFTLTEAAVSHRMYVDAHAAVWCFKQLVAILLFWCVLQPQHSAPSRNQS